MTGEVVSRVAVASEYAICMEQSTTVIDKAYCLAFSQKSAQKAAANTDVNTRFFFLTQPEEVLDFSLGKYQNIVSTGLGLPLSQDTNDPRVCRFFATKSASHFFTADSGECAFLRSLNPTNDADSGLIYEGTEFRMKQAIGQTCPSGFQPVYRLYNEGHTGGKGNHRYTIDLAVYDVYRQIGWTGEGVVMCSPQ